MQYKTKAKKHLGQNFLQDLNVISNIVRLMNISAEDNVVEIGPGLGALTKNILQKSKKINLIEYDTSIIPKLLDNCKEYAKDINVYNEDVLNFDFNKISENKFKIVGNLPYNISTPILLKIIDNIDKIKDAHFMLQKEVVNRIIAGPNNKQFGRLSVIMQYHFICSSVLDIAPDSFYPKPKVDSSIIRLIPRENKQHLKSTDNFFKVVKLCFSQRRKTLRNNLKLLLKEKGLSESSLPIDISLRAENLSVNDFVNLSNYLS